MTGYLLLATALLLAVVPAAFAWRCNGLKEHPWPVKLAVVTGAAIWLSPVAFVVAIILLAAFGIDAID